ncbi:beta-ketoacyl synthase N-terminal-like domain-containing protein [Saccharicrinis sp. GN24d3]|uniref:beta-ketoacyl synthase N-terminal-like domain-containing protein n=1 Tax=Saccharicrinis sp. GN24d3 TaxID=3458416 RepID=UPI00403660AF
MGSEMEKIAVIGMACRYPGANNIEEYWTNLINGKETIKHFTDEELRNSEINFDELKKDPKFIGARGVLDNIDKFDAKFFDFSPYDATNTDPQHRVWLETVWDAFENAGCDPITSKEAIGVFAGGYINTYLLNNILRDPNKLENFIRLRTTESFQIMTGNDISFLPTKTAYKFNLRGPAINVQTACSTSLVAISQACQSLFSYESDICVAGGVCILTPQETGYIHQEGAIPSPDGHCRPFDEEANGTVFSNGVGVVILKRLEDAIKDKDHIYAVVNGWALNNDGNKKVSYTAPSVDGQAEAILMAQGFNEVSAEDIGYVEAHGTATNLGDPIEITALTKAFARSTSKKQYCGIGSVKSNIGHTDAAAGIASFIKVCLAAYNKIIPASLNYNKPNPHIDFKNTPFFVADKPIEWNSDKKLIMGISSFGLGGTNSHVIVEEPPHNHEEIETPPKNYILPFSAKSASALQERKKSVLEFVKNHPKIRIDDLAHTLWNGRNHMKYRSSVVVKSMDELLSGDIKFDTKVSDENTNSITFMFPGQGAQYYRMGYEFYQVNDEFKSLVDQGFSLLKEETGINLGELLFRAPTPEEAEKKLVETSLTQPALFIVEYAMAKSLLKKDIEPKYLIGHSIGEYAAACIAGIFDFESALRIVIKRGQLMQSMQPGKMIAALCSKDKLIAIGNSLFEVAAENAPTNCTISFEVENQEKIGEILDENEVAWIALNTSHAFHSEAFDPILEEFANYVNSFTLSTPKIPVISCHTGKFLKDEESVSGSYWAKQLRNTVKFYKGINSILNIEPSFFIEVGPNTHLSSILKVIPEYENKKAYSETFGRRNNPSEPYIIEKVKGNIWAGIEAYLPDLGFIHPQAKKIVLPNYPFERERYWIDYKSDKKTDTVKHSPTRNEVGVGNVDLQNAIIDIWKDYLGLKDIKPTDDFFDLGGTSLLAISTSEIIKNKFKIDFGLRLFMENSTVNSIVELIEANTVTEEATKQSKTPKSNIVSGEI